MGSKDKITHVSEFLSLMSVLTNDKRFEVEYNKDIIAAEGGISMCDILDNAENKGRKEGFEIGLQKGLAISVQALLQSMSIEQVAKVLKLSVDKVKELSLEK